MYSERYTLFFVSIKTYYTHVRYRYTDLFHQVTLVISYTGICIATVILTLIAPYFTELFCK